MGKQLSACLAVMLGTLCFMGPGARAVAAPPPPPSKPASLPVWLELDLGVLEDGARERLQDQLLTKLEPVFEQAGMHLVATAELASRTVRVRMISFDAARMDYQVQLELLDGGKASTPPAINCDACSETRLVALVADSTGELLTPREQADVSPPCNPPSEPAATQVERVDPAPPPRAGGLGRAGAALLGSGMVAVAAGVYLLFPNDYRNREFAPGDGSSHYSTPNHKPVGASAVAVGAAAAVVGVTLLAVDRKRRNPRRNVALQMTPTYLGLNFVQRF